MWKLFSTVYGLIVAVNIIWNKMKTGKKVGAIKIALLSLNLRFQNYEYINSLMLSSRRFWTVAVERFVDTKQRYIYKLE